MRIQIFILIIICNLTACIKGDNAYKNVANAGTYVSEDTLVVAQAAMYTYSLFSSGSQPIFDQALIKKYVQRNGLAGFEFDSIVLHDNPGITVNFTDNGHVTLSTNTYGSNIQGSVMDNGLMEVQDENGNFLNIMIFQSFDLRMAANFVNDSCAKLNAQFATCNKSLLQSQEYKQFPIEIVSNQVSAVRFVSSYFGRSNNNICSSAFVNEIGYDAERAGWTQDANASTTRFRPGDTLVIQTKKVMLKRK